MKEFALAAALLIVATSIAKAQYDPQMCRGLWYQRNAIFKSAGYCFKTRDAIQVFGNAGCQYDNIEEVPLSDIQRSAVQMYAREERAYGCTYR